MKKTITAIFASGFLGLIVTIAIFGMIYDIVGIVPAAEKFMTSTCGWTAIFIVISTFLLLIPKIE